MANLALKRSAGTGPPRPATCSAEMLQVSAKVLDTMREAVVIMDAKFRVTAVNPAFTDITGYTVVDVMGKRPPFHAALKKKGGRYAAMLKALKTHGTWQGEVWSKRKTGDDYAESLTVSAITGGSGKVERYVAVTGDITRHKEDEERIHYQANYDALTGLPNRFLFLDRLGQALANEDRTGTKLGLLFINLDGFKLVNDTLGHAFGDLLLKEASARLDACARATDTVARLGGDEFTIIMPSLKDARHTSRLAQRALDSLARPFELDGHEAYVSASIGITIYPDDATDAGDLLKNAATAMDRAKNEGRANYQSFTSALNEEFRQRLIIRNGLSKALERGEFTLHYQPKVEILSGRITGVEALMRWDSADIGRVPPVQFIPVLEETGQVVEVGEWAIRTACLQHKAWYAAGLPPLCVAVNLSARQLRESSFVSVVGKVLRETGVDAAGLELEITESMLISDSEASVRALGQLHEMGIQLAMDDFGTGYSSLSYLKRFPIDTIKIDRSFVADLATDPDDVEIIKAIITIGHSLNRKVIAEGVETAEQLAILRKYRCDEMQGYLFSRPLPAEEMTEFLKEKMLQCA